MSTPWMNTGPQEADARLLLAHGAGAPADSPFMQAIATAIGSRGIAVSRFEFDYMAARRTGGRKRPPPAAERLVDEFRRAIATMAGDGRRLLIGGKSLGGRVASLIADDVHAAGTIAGLVCLGYPFHPPGKPDQLRTAHLAKLRCPTLIVQGERDPFGSKTEAAAFDLSDAIRLVWIGDGDHDFGPRGASGWTRSGNLDAAADAVATFAASAVGAR